jgi:hypothetical protein
MKDSPSGSASTSGRRSRRARVFMVSLLTVAVFGAMSMFGGMSYASQVLGNTSSPSDTEYCPTAGEPDYNGDVQSNCHTGSKLQGAGGDDKPGGNG